jgi:TatD DNase family protein
MSDFLNSLFSIESRMQGLGTEDFRIISNSTNIYSSERNISLASRFPRSIIPFVGIHPEIVLQNTSKGMEKGHVERSLQRLKELLNKAAGLGEIGIDPKYGSESLQLRVFEQQIQMSNSETSMPITIHSRNSITQITEILENYSQRKSVLLHWFSGTRSELDKIQSKGYFVSFGPSLIFSKRLQELFICANPCLVLAETDSPIIFSSISEKEPLSPFAVSSVIFKMAELRSSTYQKMLEMIDENANNYLQAQS